MFMKKSALWLLAASDLVADGGVAERLGTERTIIIMVYAEFCFIRPSL